VAAAERRGRPWRPLMLGAVALIAGLAFTYRHRAAPATNGPAATALPGQPAHGFARALAILTRVRAVSRGPAAAPPVDVVAAVVPMLTGESPTAQLQTLKWARTVPGGKLPSLFPDLVNRADATPQEREAEARDRVEALIHDLEESGARAPEPRQDLPAARIVNLEKPIIAEEELQAGLRELRAEPPQNWDTLTSESR
jgi:hypothetical protein